MNPESTDSSVDLSPTGDGDRIAVVRDGRISYLPAKRVELVPEVSGGGNCRYIRRSAQGDLFVAGPGVEGMLLHSQDGGHNWVTIRSEIPQPGFMSAFTILGDDSFLALIMPSNIRGNEQCYLARSRDYGRTWNVTEMQIDLSPNCYVQGGNADILELSDGTILVTLDVKSEQEGKGPDGEVVPLQLKGIYLYAFRSRDGGHSWPERSVITFHGAESHLLELPSRKLLAAIRKQRNHRLPGDPLNPFDMKLQHGYRPEFDSEERRSEKDEDTNRIKNTFLSESYDGGSTWVNERQVSSFLQCSADLTLTSTGVLVLDLLHRYPDDLANTGIRSRVSDDEGQTWRDELYVLSQGNSEDIDSGSSYPGSIAMPDGSLIMVCANWAKERIRLEAVHWRPLA